MWVSFERRARNGDYVFGKQLTAPKQNETSAIDFGDDLLLIRHLAIDQEVSVPNKQLVQ